MHRRDPMAGLQHSSSRWSPGKPWWLSRWLFLHPPEIFQCRSHCKDRWGLRSQSEDQDLAPKHWTWSLGVLHSYGDLYTLRNGQLATVGDLQLHFDHNSLQTLLLKPERWIFFLGLTYCLALLKDFHISPWKGWAKELQHSLWHVHSPPSAVEMLSWPKIAEHDLHFTQSLTIKDNNYLHHNCNSNNLTRDIAQKILRRALSIKVTSSVTIATQARSAALFSFAVLGGDKYTFMAFQMLVYKVSFIIHAP